MSCDCCERSCEAMRDGSLSCTYQPMGIESGRPMHFEVSRDVACMAGGQRTRLLLGEEFFRRRKKEPSGHRH